MQNFQYPSLVTSSLSSRLSSYIAPACVSSNKASRSVSGSKFCLFLSDYYLSSIIEVSIEASIILRVFFVPRSLVAKRCRLVTELDLDFTFKKPLVVIISIVMLLVVYKMLV